MARVVSDGDSQPEVHGEVGQEDGVVDEPVRQRRRHDHDGPYRVHLGSGRRAGATIARANRASLPAAIEDLGLTDMVKQHSGDVLRQEQTVPQGPIAMRSWHGLVAQHDRRGRYARTKDRHAPAVSLDNNQGTSTHDASPSSPLLSALPFPLTLTGKWFSLLCWRVRDFIRQGS